MNLLLQLAGVCMRVCFILARLKNLFLNLAIYRKILNVEKPLKNSIPS